MRTSRFVPMKDSGIGIDLPDGRSILGVVIGSDPRLRTTIVRAVNSHDALTAALRAMVDHFKPFTMKPVGAEGSSARADQDAQIKAYSGAVAVLSTVKGEA
ncbi:MAG: hypothetical protein H0U63_04225 [Burkholderiales bacterium]|nr:hypothetical protein [Burkholderiales bacterium]